MYDIFLFRLCCVKKTYLRRITHFLYKCNEAPSRVATVPCLGLKKNISLIAFKNALEMKFDITIKFNRRT